jgi:hypothetical protein
MTFNQPATRNMQKGLRDEVQNVQRLQRLQNDIREIQKIQKVALVQWHATMLSRCYSIPKTCIFLLSYPFWLSPTFSWAHVIWNQGHLYEPEWSSTHQHATQVMVCGQEILFSCFPDSSLTMLDSYVPTTHGPAYELAHPLMVHSHLMLNQC